MELNNWGRVVRVESMNKETSVYHNAVDRNYQRESGLIHSLIVRIFRRHINKVAKSAIGRAFERTQISSVQMHEIAGTIDRMLWPERYGSRSNVVQKNIVCGGDVAGGDIHK